MALAVDHLHAVTRQPGEVDACHGNTFAQATDDAPERGRGFDLRASDVVQ